MHSALKARFKHTQKNTPMGKKLKKKTTEKRLEQLRRRRK